MYYLAMKIKPGYVCVSHLKKQYNRLLKCVYYTW